MGTLFTYHRCCECDQQASVMRSSGDGGPSTVAVWYCETHSTRLPPYSMEGDVQVWRDLMQERDAAVAKERDALRTLLLDCEMIETSDGIVHLRSNIKDALEAIRARSKP